MWAGAYYPSRNFHLGILAAAWCLTAFIFVNVYCGTLTSYLAASYNRPDINSMHDLAHSSKYQMVVLKGILPENEMLVCDQLDYKYATVE
jgi:hypothetical protein